MSRRQEITEKLKAIGISLEQLAICTEHRLKVLAKRIGITSEELHLFADRYSDRIRKKHLVVRVMRRHQREKRRQAEMADTVILKGERTDTVIL